MQLHLKKKYAENVERRDKMQHRGNVKPEDFVGVYKDVAEVIGVDATIALHNVFQGQQITLPKKLYTHEYILSQVSNNTNVKDTASRFGYTERRLRQIIKDNRC